MKKVDSIAVIMDGNRRYAEKNNLKRKEGHLFGLKKMYEFLSWSEENDIKQVCVYCFSDKNWNREEKEINDLMDIFLKAFKEDTFLIEKYDFSVKFIGHTKKLSQKIQDSIKEVEEKTKDKKRKCVIAISYDGKEEILSGVKNICRNISNIDMENFSEKDFGKYLWSCDMKDPDLLIRTGGHKRLSGFLTWKSTYSEIFFVDTLWPEFSKKEFEAILNGYRNDVEINLGK